MDESDRDLWGINERASQEKEAFENECYDIDLMLYKAFSTPNGKKALQYLTDFSNQFAADPSLGYDKGAAYGFFAEGMKQMIWDVKQRMERSKLGAPK